jgi:hypothetical protein
VAEGGFSLSSECLTEAAGMAAALWSRVALPSLRVAAGGTAAALFGTGASTALMAAYASYNIHAKRPRNYADDFVSCLARASHPVSAFVPGPCSSLRVALGRALLHVVGVDARRPQHAVPRSAILCCRRR